MTINERIRYLRKKILKLNQTDFADEIGMRQTGLSYMERDGGTVTDRTIKSICLIYNVNETWLRTGEGEIFVQLSTTSLDDFVQQHGATKLELDILKAYFELEPDLRQKLVQHFKSHLDASHTKLTETERAEADYIKSCSNSAQNTDLSALNIIEEKVSS